MVTIRSFTPFRRAQAGRTEPEESTALATVDQRVAHALEYIAYAMQDMNEKLDRVVSNLEKSKR